MISQVISCAREEPQAYTFQVPIPIQQESNDIDLQLIEVKHDDTVTLIITANESGIFHLHGYDLEKTVSLDSENQLSFNAYATGRFPMTFHADTKGNHQNHALEEKACSASTSLNAIQPGIAIQAEAVANTGEIEVSIQVQRFTLGEEEGHWHLYINGKLNGMYSLPTITTKSLEPGDYDLMAVLSDLNHCEYEASAMTRVAIKKDHEHATHGGEPEDEHARDGAEAEVSLGYLEVYPR